MSIIKEEDFDELYKPTKNHLDDNAGWDGNLFETFGEEYDFIVKQCEENPKKVWTLVDDDDGNMVIVAGWVFINRLGYFITEKEWETGEEYVPQDIETCN